MSLHQVSRRKRRIQEDQKVVEEKYKEKSNELWDNIYKYTNLNIGYNKWKEAWTALKTPSALLNKTFISPQ